MTSMMASMMLNYLVVFFSLFFSTSATKGTCIFKGILSAQAQQTSSVIDKTMCLISFI